MFDMCHFRVILWPDGTRELVRNVFGERTFGVRSNFDWDPVKFL